MSHTDRDMTRWRWNQHFKFTDGVSEHGGYVWDRGCPCYREPDAWKWRSWYSPHEWGVPPKWKRDQRRQERATYRDQMNRAKDWDDVAFGYRRPWYH